MGVCTSIHVCQQALQEEDSMPWGRSMPKGSGVVGKEEMLGEL
ncbi:hypothetical protein [Anaerotalea alkaliphila]|nr:hypothetical protein [Anaerotalea alkaliphila]